ncbi:hypothetical protein [Streptomyces sp. NPDC086787]|uniref:hypothetical protein n=1 Tax=Streptomyces sp. NPDC086787 TaxID=3365759 RepID=UPI0038096177
MTRPSDPGTDHSRTVPLDVETIRGTYEAVLWDASTAPVPDVTGLLLGHVQLLVPELDQELPRMRGEWRDCAVHVLTRTRALLADDIGRTDTWALATQCRALLTLLCQHSRPADATTAAIVTVVA